MIDDFSGFSKRIFEDTIADRLKQNKTQIEKKRLDKNASRRRMDKYKEAFWRAPLVYHRTKEGAYDSINNTGYRSGGGDWWGPGIYTVFDLKSTTVKKGTENPYNDGDSYPTMYGPVIIENEVQHLDNFLILDYDVAKPVYEPRLGPGNFLLTYQLAEILPQSVYEKHRTLIESCEKRCSDLAAANPPFAYTTDVYRDIFGVKEIIAYLRGVIMTGPNDGRTLISYDEENITPVSYSLDKAKTWNEFDKKGAYETAKRRQKEILSGNLSSKELSDQISQQAKGAANSVIAKFGEATIHTTVMEAVEYYFKNFSFLIDASSALSEEERIECLPIVINALLEKGVDNKKFYNSAKLCFLSIVGVDMAEKIKEGLDLLSSAEESGEAIRLLAELNRFDKLASFDHKLASGIMKKVCAWIKSQEDRSMGILFKRFIDDVLSRISFGADSALYPLLDMLLLVESGYITKSNYANAFYAASCYRMLNAAIEGSSPDVSEIVSCLEAFGGMESADGEDGIPQLPFQEQGVLEYIKDIFGANSKIDTNPQTIYMYQCMMGLIFLKDDQLKPLEPYLGKFYEGWLLDMRRASLKVCKTNLEMQLPEKVVDSIASESLRKMAESDYILKKAIEQNKLNCSFASLSGVLANMAGGESKKYLEAAYMESISTKDLKSPFETIAGKIPQMTGLPSLDEYADPFSDGWAPSEQKDADVDSAVKSEYDMIYSILSILKKKGVSLSIDDLEESAPAGQMSEFGFSVIAGMRLDKLIQLKEAIGFFDIALKAKIAGMAGMNIGLFHSGIFLKRSVEVSRSSLENPDVLKAISEMCESPEFKYGDISIGRSSDGTSAMLSWTSIVAAKLYSDGLPEILSPIAEKIRKALSGDSAHRILNGMSSLGTEKSGEQMLRCLMALGVKKGDIDADAYHDIILDYIQKNGIDFAMTDKAGLTSNMSIIAKIQSAWKLEGAARAEKMKELSREFEPDRRFLEDYKLAKSNVYQLMEDAYYLGIKPSDVKDFYPGYFHQACETYLVALLQGGESERLSEFAEYLKSEIDSLKYDQNFSGDEKGKFGLYKIDYESMKPISDFETLKKLVSYKIVDISDAYRFKMEDSCLAEMVRSFPPSTTSDNFGKMLDRVEDKEKVCRAAIDSCAPHLAIEAFERIGKPQELLPKIAAKIGKDDIEELVKVLVYSKDKASISKAVPEEAKRELASLLPDVMKENKLNSIEDFCEFLLKEYGGQYSPEDVSALAAAIRGFMPTVNESFVMGFGAFRLKRKGII